MHSAQALFSLHDAEHTIRIPKQAMPLSLGEFVLYCW